MEITSWQLYWLTRLDGIINVGVIFLIFGIVLTLVAGVVCFVFYDDKYNDVEFKKSKVGLVVSIPLLIFGIVTQCFIPSTKEMAAILIVPKLTRAISANEQIQKLPNNLVTLANEWIESLKPKSDK